VIFMPAVGGPRIAVHDIHGAHRRVNHRYPPPRIIRQGY